MATNKTQTPVDAPCITNTGQLMHALNATTRTAGVVANASMKLRELRMLLRNAEYIVADLMTEEEKATLEHSAHTCTALIERLQAIMDKANASTIAHVSNNTAHIADADALRLDKYVSQVKTKARQKASRTKKSSK